MQTAFTIKNMRMHGCVWFFYPYVICIPIWPSSNCRELIVLQAPARYNVTIAWGCWGLETVTEACCDIQTLGVPCAAYLERIGGSLHTRPCIQLGVCSICWRSSSRILDHRHPRQDLWYQHDIGRAIPVKLSSGFSSFVPINTRREVPRTGLYERKC